MSVHAVVSRASSFDELEHGVAFRFETSDDMARSVLDLVLAEGKCCAQFNYSLIFGPRQQPIELRIEADGALIAPLKDLYLGLASQHGVRDHAR